MAKQGNTVGASEQQKVQLATNPSMESMMTNWDRFKARLFTLRGQMVTVTIMVGRDGAPICWSFPEQKRIENLPVSSSIDNS